MSYAIPATEPKTLIDIPTGRYTAVVAGVEPGTAAHGDVTKFFFAVDGEEDQEGNPLELWGFTSPKLNANTKLWKWVKAISGQEPTKGQPYDVEDLIGRPCILWVDRRETEEGIRCRVESVEPPKKQPAPEPAPPATDAGTCSECEVDVSYFTTEGVPYCGEHGPLAGKAGA